MVLSRDCDGCGNRQPDAKRFRTVKVGERVYCPDGTPHLVDSGSKTEAPQ